MFLKRVQDTLDNKANLRYIKELEEDVEHNHNSMMIYNQIIKKYNATIMWRPDDISLNAINIKIDDKWYGTIAEDKINGNGAKGLSSFAQAAYLINLPVDVCVKGKYLRGLEGVH